jgi:CubicO group peptidase (beta-lactamase class C family)
MIQGYCEPEFSGVARVLRRQVRAGGGAAVCIYHRGRKVVDLWAGVRDREGRPWLSDTLSMSFSTTKGVVATALHVLADRGLCRYDDPVAKYWPAFGQAGKEAITLRDVLSHRSGLPQLRPLLDRAERILDWDYMVHALERATPRLRPGGDSAYHALTYGWLAGEIVQRVSGRDLMEVIRTEIGEPLGIDDLHIGTRDPEVIARVAALDELAPTASTLAAPLMSRGLARGLRWLSRGVARLPIDPLLMQDALIPGEDADLMFSPRILEAPVPAANGLFTARALARMYAALAEGGALDGVRLFSKATLRSASEVQIRRPDRVLLIPMHWRLGYHSAFTTSGRVASGFGHFGYGGSGAWADPQRRISFAMVNNRGGGTPFGDLRIAQLGAAALHGARVVRGRSADRQPAPLPLRSGSVVPGR